jgi:hypothetical protein
MWTNSAVRLHNGCVKWRTDATNLVVIEHHPPPFDEPICQFNFSAERITDEIPG